MITSYHAKYYAYELTDLHREIGLKKREAKLMQLEQKVILHRQIKDLERRRNEKRKSLFDAEDEIDAKKEELISEIENKLKQSVREEDLFCVKWTLS